MKLVKSTEYSWSRPMPIQGTRFEKPFLYFLSNVLKCYAVLDPFKFNLRKTI